MPRTAKVNYHVHKPKRQAFHIDAGGIVGNLVAPELVVSEIAVKDIRAREAFVSFADDAVAFTRFPTQVDAFDQSDHWRAIYDAELTSLLSHEIDAKEVVVFDHTIRIDDAAAERKPARNVHSDYSADGAEQRLVDILGPKTAADWRQGHFAFINLWRPLEYPINSAPLGFVRPSSSCEEDWMLLDLIYPDRVGQILGLAGNTRHEWIYQSKMTPDEVVFFNIYDNRGRPAVGHSALDMIEDDAVIRPRKSIESRTLVRF